MDIKDRIKISAEEIERRFDSLSDSVADIFESALTSEIIFEIGKSQGLMIDKIGQIAEEIGYWILGFIPDADFVAEINKIVDDAEKAKIIAAEINQKIFLPIREALKKATGGEGTGDQALGTGTSDRGLDAEDRALGTKEQGTAVQEVKPLVIRPITGITEQMMDALKREAGSGKRETAPTRMEDVKIPGPKADLNGKISPIISRIGIQRTADKGTGNQALGTRTSDQALGTRDRTLGTREQGTKIAMPIIEEVKQPKVAVPPPVPEPRVLPSAKPFLYDEIKARAEQELKELIEKERGEGASGQALGANAGTRNQALDTTPSPAAKPAIPPTPKPLKLPQEKIPKPQAPEQYSTDPYKEPIE